ACSTDDRQIAEAATAWGAAIVERPASLATADATSVDVAIHALDTLETSGRRFRRLVLLQPTSPLTEATDVVAAVARADADDRGVVSVTTSHPGGFHVGRDPGGDIFLRDDAFAADDRLLSGAFYVVSPGALRRDRSFIAPGQTLGFEVPPERSIDIDDAFDLEIVRSVAINRPVRPIQIGDN